MRNPGSLWLIIATIVLAGLAAAPAVGDSAATAAELALLPAWCRYAALPVAERTNEAIVRDPAIRAKLYAMTAAGCGEVQRYCSALLWTNRGLFSQDETPAAALANYRTAVTDYQALLKTAVSSGKCPLFADIHTKIGALEVLLGKPKEAEASFRGALAVKPGYAPAFIGLSDMYESQEQSDQALAILQAGIKANPQSTALKKKLARLQARTGGQAATP